MEKVKKGMDRDFIGYGPNKPPVEWPDGARVAVSLSVAYEEGSEYSLLDGDPHRELTGDIVSPVPIDQRDLVNESMFEYGSRVGVWRILDLLDQHGVKATFFCCGLALERNPEVGPEITRRGHDICGHGYRWVEAFRMDRETERQDIRKTVEVIECATGQRPLGWHNRYAHSLNTRELVVEEGGFLYDSNAYNDDIPYFVPVSDKRWLVVPYSFDTNDARSYRAGGSVGDYFQSLVDTLDRLYEEGETSPKMMSVGIHCRISGRPGRARVLGRFLEYARGLPGVWLARRSDIARWWWEKYG